MTFIANYCSNFCFSIFQVWLLADVNAPADFFPIGSTLTLTRFAECRHYSVKAKVLTSKLNCVLVDFKIIWE